MRYIDYPPVDTLPLDAVVPGWANGEAIRIPLAQFLTFLAGTDPSLTGLIEGLANEITTRESEIAALQTEVAALTTFREQAGFIDTPGASELLAQMLMPFDVALPANFGSNIGYYGGADPAAAVTFTVKQILTDGTTSSVGTLVIGTNSAITRTTTSPTGFDAPQGSVLQLLAPVDAKGVTNLSEIFIGTKAS